MIKYKALEEIAIMAEGGKRLRRIADRLAGFVKAGIKTNDIERLAEELIRKAGGEASFKKVKGYQWSTCLPVNEQIVHTPPSARILENGDILTIDIGMYYEGFHTDYATTLSVGLVEDPGTGRFLRAGQEVLQRAIEQAAAHNYLGQISRAIQTGIRKYGYYVIKELTGHGIGKELHEDPMVLGFLNKPIKNTLELKPGLVLAIEVIYSRGTEETVCEAGNQWSIVTRDRSLAACFENTIAILADKTIVLT